MALASRAKFLISRLGKPRPRVRKGSYEVTGSGPALRLMLSLAPHGGTAGRPCPLSQFSAQRKHSLAGSHLIQSRMPLVRRTPVSEMLKCRERTVCLRTNKVPQ